jgi:hypothetical protein
MSLVQSRHGRPGVHTLTFPPSLLESLCPGDDAHSAVDIRDKVRQCQLIEDQARAVCIYAPEQDIDTLDGVEGFLGADTRGKSCDLYSAVDGLDLTVGHVHLMRAHVRGYGSHKAVQVRALHAVVVHQDKLGDAQVGQLLGHHRSHASQADDGHLRPLHLGLPLLAYGQHLAMVGLAHIGRMHWLPDLIADGEAHQVVP